MSKFSETNLDCNNHFNKFNYTFPVGGVTHPQESGGIRSGSMPSVNFHDIQETGTIPPPFDYTVNTKTKIHEDKTKLFKHFNQNLNKEFSEIQEKPLSSIEAQMMQTKIRIAELENKLNLKLGRRGHSSHMPTQSTLESPDEAFPRNTAPTAHAKQTSHCTSGVTHNITNHRVRFANNGEADNNSQPSYAFYPPRDQYQVNSRIADLKKTIKIDTSNDPRDELRFFEKTCRTNGIFSEPDMYTILITVWPNQDIRNYWAVSEEEEECYQGLKRFLSDKNGKLNRIFKPQPNWSTVSGMALTIEVKKYMSELLKGDNLKKYLYLQLAPESLKCKIKEIIGCDIEKFESRCRDICDASYQDQKNGFPPFQQ